MRFGRGSRPIELANQTSPGACVARASMEAAAGINDAMPLQTWSPSLKYRAARVRSDGNAISNRSCLNLIEARSDLELQGRIGGIYDE